MAVIVSMLPVAAPFASMAALAAVVVRLAGRSTPPRVPPAPAAYWSIR